MSPKTSLSSVAISRLLEMYVDENGSELGLRIETRPFPLLLFDMKDLPLWILISVTYQLEGSY